jgi:DNA-binding transcriptional MocR family regulator
VLHCGSFTKSLTAGVRIGWALAGRWREQVERLKFINTHSTSALAQQGVAAYLANDGWDLQLRGVRQTLEERSALMRSMVRRFFPEGTRLSHPAGGYLLWIELPAATDTLALYREALERGISIAPGRVFSNADLYPNCLRLNYSAAWTPQVEEAVKTLARMAAHARTSDKTGQAAVAGGPAR